MLVEDENSAMADDTFVGAWCLEEAAAGDAEAIAGLWEAAWRPNLCPQQVRESAEKVKREITGIDPSQGALIVARFGAETAGFCRVAVDKGDSSLWWIMGVAVQCDRRCRGIGAALLRAGIAYAREIGAATVRSTADPWNQASIRCHEKAGFVNEGEFVAEDGERKVRFSTRTH